MIQLPAGATVAIPGQGRDFGLGWWPGGVPGIQIGLIETMRAREGRVPWLGGHLARLKASLAALGAPEPPGDLADLVRFAVGTGDRVVRLQLTDGHPEIATRDVSAEQAVHVVVA